MIKDIVIIALLVAAVLLLLLLNIIPSKEKKQKKVIEKAGDIGEITTDYLLSKHLKNGSYLLENCYLPRRSSYTEIDCILACPQGLFVVENKYYSGVLYGNEHDEKWTKVRTYGHNEGVPEEINSPIKQNDTHIRSVREQVKGNVKIYSVLVFSDKCDLSQLVVTRKDVFVINTSEIPDFMREIYSMEPVLKQATVDAIYKKLQPTTNVPESVKKKHINDIKREHRNNYENTWN